MTLDPLASEERMIVSHFDEHPLYPEVHSELNARPTHPIAKQTRVRRLALMQGEYGSTVNHAFEQFSLWGSGHQTIASSARQVTVLAHGRTITCEQHNEFVTLTWTGALTDDDELFDASLFSCFREMVFISAARIDVTGDETVSQTARSSFNSGSLCYSVSGVFLPH